MSQDNDNLREKDRLVLLLQALDSILNIESASEILGEDCIKEFDAVRVLVTAWLRDESPLPKEQRLKILTTFTAALAEKLPMLRTLGTAPDRILH
ncbi:hypothetical protein [Denitratisoma sp. agr-D3]